VIKLSYYKRIALYYVGTGADTVLPLQELSLRITVAEGTDDGRGENVGHVIIGPEASGMGITHWNQMLATLRKPVSMWHPLRRT
jgi:hypothetical protein